MQAALDTLEARLGYHFRDPGLLLQALSHKSVAEGAPETGTDNERMEFLGDSILGFITSEWLLRKFPTHHEGSLSKLKAHLVSASNLHDAAQRLALGPHLLLGRGEELSGGREKKRLLANAIEAIIAAIYLDGGIEPVRRFVVQHVLSAFDSAVADGREVVNFKGALKEIAEALNLPPPQYTILEERGPDHAKTFIVEVKLGRQYCGRAEGLTKKGASQTAAKLVLEELLMAHPEMGRF